MSETKWTSNQLEAIESNKSTLVSASAGTGKTAVLTERVVNQVLKGIDISNILVMTFSAKAADEMKNRIISKLKDKLAEIEEQPLTKTTIVQKKHIYSQINSLGNAPIQTIHSFCNDILKRYCYIVNIDPKFKVATGPDIAVLRKTAVDNILEKEYAESSSMFNFLYDYVGEGDTIENVIISSYNSLMSILDGFKWLSAEIEKYNIDCTYIPDFVKELLLNDFNQALSLYNDVRDSLMSFDDEKITKILKTINYDINTIKAAIDYIKNDNIRALNPSLFSAFGATIRFPEGLEEEKAKRNAGREIIVSKYKTEPLHMPTQLARIKATYPIAKYFESLLIKFKDEYTKVKREQNVIDFNDMEHMAYTILKNPIIANSYRSSFFAVYVDEYQDTSPIQEAIINSVSTSSNLFCVGDLKQSIYRFRSSDPILFKNRMESYDGKTNKKIISLNHNFRSSANVINCANDVFKAITPYSSEITYTTADELVHGRADGKTDTPVTIEIINTATNKDAYEISNIVRIIKNRLGKPIYDPSIDAERPAEYRDFAILSRKVIKYSSQICEIFTKNNIPFEIEKNGELMETPEVMTLVALLQLIINSNNDINILTVMHQGLFGFNDDDIMEVRVVDESAPFINNIKTLANDVSDDDVNKKCKEFIGFLTLCNEKQHLYSLARLVSYVIDRAYINDIFAVKENGSHRMDNLKMFTNYAAEYEHKYHKKLYSFLKYMNDVAEGGETIGEARSSGSANSVKITTIHKSKGLEYPIVILAFMSTTFSDIGKRASIIIDRDAGVGFKFFDREKRIRSKNFLRTSIENKVMSKNKEEEMRLLYVAMTRAKEELYIQGVNSFKAPIDMNNATTMMEWVVGTAYTATAKEDSSELEMEKNSGLNGNWELENVETSSLTEYMTGNVSDVEVTLPEVTLSVPVPTRKHIDKVIPIPKSVSASSLEKINSYDRSMFAMPDFMTSTSAADMGSSVHKFLRYAELAPGMTDNDIHNSIEELVARGTLSPKDKSNISDTIIHGISKMTNSEFFNDMMFSDIVLKEKNLYTSVNSSEYIKNNVSKEVLVRCIVDIAYKVADGYVVADYKTDNITEKDIPATIEKHKKQVKTYSKCFENVYGVPVVSSYLVLLSLGKVVKL